MERVYADPKSGYTWGHFPKPWSKITKNYDCPTPRLRDTLGLDTLEMPMDTPAILAPALSAPISLP
jgi:penicillin-binding protein 1A